jgi:hypothetical protein
VTADVTRAAGDEDGHGGRLRGRDRTGQGARRAQKEKSLPLWEAECAAKESNLQPSD